MTHSIWMPYLAVSRAVPTTSSLTLLEATVTSKVRAALDTPNVGSVSVRSRKPFRARIRLSKHHAPWNGPVGGGWRDAGSKDTFSRSRGNSEDILGGQTPSPFDRPPVDDHFNISGADPSYFTAAQGKKTPPGKLVIGKNVGGNNCTQ